MTNLPRNLTIVLCTSVLLAVCACTKKDEAGTQTAEAPAKAAPATTGTAPAASSLPDPCKLLTVEQATAILDKPVKPGKRGHIEGVNDCTWEGDRGVFSSVTVDVRVASFYDSARSMENTAEDVAGIGDKAFYGTMITESLVFVKGATYVHVAVMGAKAKGLKERVLSAGKSLASRM